MAGFGDIGRLVATLGLNTAPFMAGMNAAESKMAEVSKNFQVVGRTMTRFVTIPMALAGGAAIATSKDFEASMTKIVGLVGVARDQVEAWKKDILNMATVVGKGPEELADAMYFVTSAGIRGKEAMEVLEMSAKASAAGLGEVKVVADLVTSAMNAYGKENLSAAQATDILVAAVREGKAEADELAGAMGMTLPIASEFGVTFDQVGAAFAGMTRTGTNARVAATQLKAILSAMASPSVQSQKALAEFGMSAEDFRRTVREDGLIQALLDLRTAVGDNEEGLAHIFPNIRALMGTLDLLGANVEYNKRIFDALKDSSGSLERAFAEVGGTIQQKLNVAIATFKASLVQLGDAMKPFVVGILTRVTDKLRNTTAAVDAMTEGQKKMRLAMMAVTAAAGPMLLIVSRLLQILSLSGGPLTIVLTAVVALTAAFLKLRAAQGSTLAVQRTAAKERERITATIGNERAAIDQLFVKLKSATKGTEEWNAIRDEILGKYDKYLVNMSDEVRALNDIETAQKEVTKARTADIAVQSYREEQTRLEDQFAANFQKRMKNWVKIVEEGRVELWEEAGRTPAEFYARMQEALDESSAILTSGATAQEIIDSLHDISNDIYKEFIAGLENAPKAFGRQRWMMEWMDLTALRRSFDKEIGTLDDLITPLLPDQIEPIDISADVKLQIENIDTQLQGMEDIRSTMDEMEYLTTVLALHQDKLALLTGEQADAEQAIISSLEEQLRVRRAVRSTLGEEARMEAHIETLQKERKKLSGDALELNSLAIAQAQLELDTLQLHRSGLNQIEKLRGKITLLTKEGAYLEGEAAKKNRDAIRDEEKKLRYLELEQSGYNEISMLQGLISLKQQEMVYLTTEQAKEASKAIIDMQRRAELMQAEIDGTGELGQLKIQLKWLEEDLTRLTGKRAQEQQRLIYAKKEEIAVVEDTIAGYNKEERLRRQISRLEEKSKTLSGAQLNFNRYLTYSKQIELAQEMQKNKYLSKSEQIGWKIVEIQTKLTRTLNPEEERQYEGQLRYLNEKKRIMEEIEGLRTGDIAPQEGTREHWQQLMNSLAALKELKAEGEITAKEFGRQFGNIIQGIAGFANYYAQMIGGFLSNVLSERNALLEAQKQKELSAAGDNAKKRAAIEKKYFEKQKKLAVAQGYIDTALAVLNALATVKPFWAALAMAGVAAAAGAMQIRAIKAQSMKEGGLAYGETLVNVADYPGSRSNPEVIAPLSDLKKLLKPMGTGEVPEVIELRLKGRDAYAMMRMEQLLQNTY